MGLPLQVRHEIFSGVRQPETFTKTNTPASEQILEAQKEKTRTLQLKSLIAQVRNGRQGAMRLALHASIIALAVIAVGAGHVHSQAGLVSVNTTNDDQTSMIATGAILSQGSAGALAADVNQKAKDLNSQTSLATAGDEFLAKKQPILTAGLPSRDIITYSVKEGDTLSALAQKFNITSDSIKWANNLADESSIKPAMKLIILPVSGILYTAQGDDDLSAVATRYQANLALIDSFNGLEGKLPTAGQKLIIPDGIQPSAAPAARLASVSNSSSGLGYFSGSRYSGGGNSYYWGQCTWYVANRRSVPGNWGNAYSWLYGARAAGWATGSAPRSGAIGVERGINHVVYIESVNSDGSVNLSEMNWGGRPGVVHYRTEPASRFNYIY